MPRRALVPLDRFKDWCRLETRHPDTQAATMVAIRDHAHMANVDVEATMVSLLHPNRQEEELFATADAPFRLSILETPLAEFKAWGHSGVGDFMLEPRWHVRILHDPAGRSSAGPGTIAWILPRAYFADALHPSTTPPPPLQAAA